MAILFILNIDWIKFQKASCLVNYVDAVVELLVLQEWMHVTEEHPKLFLPISVRDNNGDVVPGATLRRTPQSTRIHFWVESGESLEARDRNVVNRNLTFWTPEKQNVRNLYY